LPRLKLPTRHFEDPSDIEGIEGFYPSITPFWDACEANPVLPAFDKQLPKLRLRGGDGQGLERNPAQGFAAGVVLDG